MHGQCMCGAVHLDITGELRPVVNCHCFRCRRWTGHYLAATAASTTAISITDDGTLTWFAPVDGVEYGFCSRCGSSLLWRLAERPDLISISAGCLDQPTGLSTTTQIWMVEHGDYHPPIEGIADREYD